MKAEVSYQYGYRTIIIVHGYLKGDIHGAYYRLLAIYIVKFVELSSIDVKATTGLNEPVTDVMSFIYNDSLVISRDDCKIFIKLHQSFKPARS